MAGLFLINCNTQKTEYQMIQSFNKDKLTVKIYSSRDELGRASAIEAGNKIKELLKTQESVAIIFAAAPSQNEFLVNLVNQDSIDWNRIDAFHMDEYIGLQPAAPQGFGNFLKDRIFSLKPFRSVQYLNGQCKSKEDECTRYGQLIAAHPIDIVFMGIGENGHIAFNDPHVADFNDKALVKVVELDTLCRQQQVNDGCFETIAQVPTHAFTVTIPVLLKARFIYCMVPGTTKAQAVANTFEQEVSERYPSTILRKHPAATLYLDQESAGKLSF
jgi:glucosamine-6-phosphate deaminase